MPPQPGVFLAELLKAFAQFLEGAHDGERIA
jgi:hypothetical protein